MYTKVKDKKTGEITKYRTHQYKSGTYIIINDNPAKQFYIDEKEGKLHKFLRENKNSEVIEKY